jgi:hypothetical protein
MIKSTDEVLTMDSSKQEPIYRETASPIVEFVLEGYNGTIFAYGQTGTGKTHTIEGREEDHELRGVMPRAFEGVFKAIEGDPNKQYLVRASYMELYKEEIRDLLSRDPKNKLEIKEHPEKGVYVKDLSSFVVKSVQDLKEVMYTGRKNRTTASTNMNETSSRSHSIFTLTIETAQMGIDLKSHIRVGKLNIVDLAGSERLSKTGATGERLEEATKINLSLSTLCHVIATLTEYKEGTYVPYRNSKLTRMLQDSLGGNTKTMMVANIGPAGYNYEESLNTLRYANRAKNIVNKPRINEDPKDAMIREFRDEITRLKRLLAERLGMKVGKDGEIVHPGAPGSAGDENAQMQKQMEAEMQKQNEELKQKEAEIHNVEAQTAMAEEEKMKLLDSLKKQQEEKEKAKKEQHELIQQMKQYQEKLLQGKKDLEEARQKELELQRTQEAIKEAREKERRMAEAIKRREAETMSIESKFSSKQEELAYKTNKLEDMLAKCREAQAELDERNEELRVQREELFKTVHEYQMQVDLKQMVQSD